MRMAAVFGRGPAFASVAAAAACDACRSDGLHFLGRLLVCRAAVCRLPGAVFYLGGAACGLGQSALAVQVMRCRRYSICSFATAAIARRPCRHALTFAIVCDMGVHGSPTLRYGAPHH